jgi:tripartite-type tricarboxylate transporter receptor subunit TctC
VSGVRRPIPNAGWQARLAGAALAAIAFASSAEAQSVADFYSHMPLTLVVGSGVGGGFDLYAGCLRPITRSTSPAIPRSW